MRFRYRRAARAVSLALAGAFLMAGVGTTCTSFAGRTALSATDFCFIFDCQNAVGGTVDLCAQTEVYDPGTGQYVDTGRSLLVDCP